MSWQQNTMMQRSFEAPSGQKGVPNESSGDSRILRYIKTLTNHQTNAKQQRMDSFLQQVKHHQPTETKPPRYPPAFKAQDKLKSSASLVAGLPSEHYKKTTTASKKLRPVAVESKTNSGHGNKVRATGRKNENRPRGKRSYEGEQTEQQRKKTKRASSYKLQKSSVGSLDRFSFNGTWSQGKAKDECAGSETPQFDTASFPENKFAQHEIRSLPRTTKSTSGAIGAGSEYGDETPAQLPPTTFPTTEEARNSSFLETRFLSPEQVQLEDLEDAPPTEEVFIPSHDPLSSIMESIYF